MDNLDINALVNHYMDHCRYEKRLDEKTLKAYKIDLNQFFYYSATFGDYRSKECLQAYIAALHGKYAVKSVKRKIASLKAFFNYLAYEEIIESNPFSKIQIKLHEPFILPRTIPFDTIGTLLQCAYRQADLGGSLCQHNANLRDIAILELLFATGMRISELCSLHNEDVNLLDGSIKIYGKKTCLKFVLSCFCLKKLTSFTKFALTSTHLN